MKSTIIDDRVFPDAPVPGARKVWFYIKNIWVHSGWLMPEPPYERRPQ